MIHAHKAYIPHDKKHQCYLSGSDTDSTTKTQIHFITLFLLLL